MSVDNYILKRENSMLLIVDMQDKLFGAMDTENQKELIKNNIIMIETAKTYGLPVVVSEQYSKGLGKTITPIAERISDIMTHEKMTFDCLRDKDLENAIMGADRNTVIITGIETHVCVLQTALSLIKKGNNAVIVSNAVASRKNQDREMALKMLASAGAVVYPSETVSFMLIERAGTPDFKYMANFFK